MARTFTETTRERAREALEGDRSSGPDLETVQELFEIFTRAIPEGLGPDSLDRRTIGLGERREQFRDLLDELLGEGVGANLAELEAILREANDVDLSELSGEELQRFMAQVQLAQANASVASLETLVTKAVFLDDIATAVEAPSNIAVNGVNDTGSDAGVAVEVLPQSEDRDFPVRRLILKAEADNKEKIYFGDDDVSPEAGFALDPGESIHLDLDFRDTTLYMAAEKEAQEVSFLGLL